MKNLESQWIVYRDACYPPKNGKLDVLQETEIRQAFFAGCLVVLGFSVESARNLSEDQAVRQIASLIREAQTVCSQRVYEMKGRN